MTNLKKDSFETNICGIRLDECNRDISGKVKSLLGSKETISKIKSLLPKGNRNLRILGYAFYDSLDESFFKPFNEYLHVSVNYDIEFITGGDFNEPVRISLRDQKTDIIFDKDLENIAVSPRFYYQTISKSNNKLLNYRLE